MGCVVMSCCCVFGVQAVVNMEVANPLLLCIDLNWWVGGRLEVVHLCNKGVNADDADGCWSTELLWQCCMVKMTGWHCSVS